MVDSGPDIPLVEGGDSLQDEGRRLLGALYGALRSLRFYPLDNDVVQQSLDELQAGVHLLLEREGGVEIRLQGNLFFVNDDRLRLDLRTYSTFSSVAETLRTHGVGEIRVDPGVRRAEWVPLLNLLLREPEPDLALEQIQAGIRAAGVKSLQVNGFPDDAPEEEEEALYGARQTYTRGVQVARELLTDVRMGRAANIRRVKRAVQGIVDQVLSNESSMVAMTHLRDFDEYTFTHSVNVCILSVIIGQRLGFGRQDLYDLGLGALFHDVGKMRIPEATLNKAGKLTPGEWAAIQEHPTDGLLALFNLRGFADLPLRAMLMAYEHHMKVDLTGYPRSRRPRELGLYSRIVAVADSFDAATSVRSYQFRPWPADKVLQEMLSNPTRGVDTVMVKALISATGVYPVGSLVILDTFELAVVVRTNPDPARLHQPVVKVISDEVGTPLPEPAMVRLDQLDPRTGNPRRTIIKTADPHRYGVDVSIYVTT